MTTLRIGITGHRVIDDPAGVARELRRARALASSRVSTPAAPVEPLHVEVLSALAEGADRLAARVLLEEPGATLIAVLPFPRDDYMTDFESDVSKSEFLELLDQAVRVDVMAPTLTREEGYESAGRRIVDEGDVLFAIWDGQPSRGRGGTAEVVEYARGAGVPVYWISTSERSVSLSQL